MALPKKEIIKFVSNEPVQLVLDTEPSTAKSTTRDSQWGMKTSYTYFTGDGRVMFPSQALHDKLRNYAKGDTVTIQLIDGKLWSVTSDGAGQKKNADIQRSLENTESTILLRKIALDIDLIKGHLFGTNTKTNDNKTENTETGTEDDSDIDF